MVYRVKTYLLVSLQIPVFNSTYRVSGAAFGTVKCVRSWQKKSQIKLWDNKLASILEKKLKNLLCAVSAILDFGRFDEHYTKTVNTKLRVKPGFEKTTEPQFESDKLYFLIGFVGNNTLLYDGLISDVNRLLQQDIIP